MINANIIYLSIALIILAVAYCCLVRVQRHISKKKRISVITGMGVYNMKKDACLDYLKNLRNSLTSAFLVCDKTLIKSLDPYIEAVRRDLGIYSDPEEREMLMQKRAVYGETHMPIDESGIVHLASDINVYIDMIKHGDTEKINLSKVDEFIDQMKTIAVRDCKMSYHNIVDLTDDLPEEAELLAAASASAATDERESDESIPCNTPRPVQSRPHQRIRGGELSCMHFEKISDAPFRYSKLPLPAAQKRLYPELYNEHNVG